ncbi:DUF6675 family protein [Roseicella sp. DB1501]|nr:DUF6675 family protein [Roseicella sp. DB1501]NOG74067.1 hypothetical protein [Roseicella sp. DB1501]
MVVVAILFCTSGSLAQEGVRPPCGGPPVPSYAAPGHPPHIRTMKVDGWTAAPCVGWTSGRSTLLVAVVGAFEHDGGVEALLAAFGRISALVGTRYWSVSDHRWRTLVTDAAALDGPDPARRRPDFTPGEMGEGGALYFVQSDSRSSGEVVYRMRVLEKQPERLVISVDNVTPVRLFLLTLFAPGDLQTTFFLERLPERGTWGYYGLWGLRTNAFTSGHKASSINRAVAMFRHTAGIPTDQEPPAAQQ